MEIVSLLLIRVKLTSPPTANCGATKYAAPAPRLSSHSLSRVSYVIPVGRMVPMMPPPTTLDDVWMRSSMLPCPGPGPAFAMAHVHSAQNKPMRKLRVPVMAHLLRRGYRVGEGAGWQDQESRNAIIGSTRRA